ncbi:MULTISPECIES: 30S ribosomal protein S14 [Haloarcula]|uniref:30S ribosomal protein S14 n=1 Tax=Haloarcula TaxID=2237 RepID=UPI0023E36EDF|nr:MULTISPECIES: 30S ribosomal protein S14 [Haloarculaceae]
MSESETTDEPDAEADTERTGQLESCQRCGREQGLVGKYDIWLCRQCFREISRGMGFKKFN